MRCPEERKLELATFLLQKGVEDWWRLVEIRRGDVEALHGMISRRLPKISIIVGPSVMRTEMSF